MADPFSKLIAETLDPSRKKTKVIRAKKKKEKAPRSERENELIALDDAGKLTDEQRTELIALGKARKGK